MTIPEYYTAHFAQYHEKTFHIDPAAFLSSFAANLKPGAHVLDIGCGSGRDLLWLAEKGFHPTGFEASPGLAALARQNANCPVIEGDFETYDFSTHQADAILMSGALVHLPHTQMEAALKNILQALKAGPEAPVYLSVKQGKGTFTDSHNRTFYLWQDPDVRAICLRIGLHVIDFSRSSSVLGTGEAWLGYVLKRTGDIPTDHIPAKHRPIDVTCAIIEKNGKVMAAQRGPRMRMPFKWEFPGGKIEPGESASQCILREITEEFGIQIVIQSALPPATHAYPDFQIRLHPFVCRITGTAAMTLSEHNAVSWKTPDQLLTLDWAAADVAVVKTYLDRAARMHDLEDQIDIEDAREAKKKPANRFRGKR